MILYKKSKFYISSFIWAISIFIKPFGFIFIPWIIYKRDINLLVFLLCNLLFISIIPAIFIGTDMLINQYLQWFREIGIELAAKESLLAAGNHTIFSIFYRYTPLRLFPTSEMFIIIYQSILLFILGLILYLSWKKGRKIDRSDGFDIAIMILLIPLISFTSYNAFIFSQLAVCAFLYNYKKLNLFAKFLGITACIMVGGNIYEIVGRYLWQLIDNFSIIAIGALILLGSLIKIRYQGIN